MLQIAQDELNQEVIDRAVALFGVDAGSVERLGSFESFVFRCTRENSTLALRLSHSSHRSEEQIWSEFDWIDYLANAGARVACPVRSCNGRLTERIDTPTGYFIASGQRWAEGQCPNPKDPEQWNESLFQEWGAVTARLHVLTKHYEPSPGIPRRHIEAGLIGWNCLNDKCREIEVIHRKVSDSILNLPRSIDTFGLCHTDLHQWNFHVDNGRIIAFDFDDSGYDNMLGDVAIALYYAAAFSSGVSVLNSKALGEFGEWLLSNFMKGYCSEHSLPHDLFVKLPEFVLRRQTLLYLVLNGAEAPEHRRDWAEATYDTALNRKPFIDMSFDPKKYL